MTPNNNISILPFYLKKSSQNHSKDYSFGEVYPLLTPDKKILPFQIIRPTRGGGISQARIMNMDGSIFLDVRSQMINTGLIVNRYQTKGYDVIIYPGILPMAITIPEGRYYMEIADNDQLWYSDVFTVVRDLTQCLKIEYWDAENMNLSWGEIDYGQMFKWNLYLPTQVGRPDYDFEEQATNRDGYQFIEKQISEKTFKFNFLAPEYLLDAIRIVRLSDYVKITSRGETYEVDQFLMTPKWQDGGHIASVQAEFKCDTVIKKIGKAYIPQDNGDFNADFNNDFKID